MSSTESPLLIIKQDRAEAIFEQASGRRRKDSVGNNVKALTSLVL